MPKKILFLLLPLFLSTHLHTQQAVTADTFLIRYPGFDSLTKQKLVAVNEKLKKVAAENEKKNEASKRTGILIILGCLVLFSLLALTFRIVNRN